MTDKIGARFEACIEDVRCFVASARKAVGKARGLTRIIWKTDKAGQTLVEYKAATSMAAFLLPGRKQVLFRA